MHWWYLYFIAGPRRQDIIGIDTSKMLPRYKDISDTRSYLVQTSNYISQIPWYVITNLSVTRKQTHLYAFTENFRQSWSLCNSLNILSCHEVKLCNHLWHCRLSLWWSSWHYDNAWFLEISITCNMIMTNLLGLPNHSHITYQICIFILLNTFF